MPIVDYNDYSDHLETAAAMSKRDDSWRVADARARFSEVIDRALREGPQTITRNGRKTAVLVSAEEWERKTRRKGNLAEFFAASPLRGSGLKIERTKGDPREIEL